MPSISNELGDFVQVEHVCPMAPVEIGLGKFPFNFLKIAGDKVLGAALAMDPGVAAFSFQGQNRVEVHKRQSFN
jgi:hypothetical protein